MLPKNQLTLIITGIFIGVMMLLGNMNIIPNEIVAFWPAILLVGLLVVLVSTESPVNATKKTTKAVKAVKVAKTSKKKARK